MLLDHQRHVVDVDLLDHPGHDRGHGFQVMPAPGAMIKAMVERIAVDQFRREGGAFVLWVTGLPADAAPLLALRRCRFGRLDDVGGRRLGRGRGILPRRGELLLETSNGALEHLQTRLLGVQLRLQAPTVRARLPCLGSRDGLCYTHRREYTTPVNGHAEFYPVPGFWLVQIAPRQQPVKHVGDTFADAFLQLIHGMEVRKGLLSTLDEV